MHKKKKRAGYLGYIVPIAFFLLIAGMLMYFNSLYVRNKIQDVYREGDRILAGMLKEKCPEISDDEIIGIINSRDGNKDSGMTEEVSRLSEEGKAVLSSFGYDTEYESARVTKLMKCGHVIDLLIACFSALMVGLVFLLRERRRREDIEKVTGYVRRLNSGDFDLMISDNTEDVISRLRNEVYRTTVILREIAEQKTEETKRLSKSLEDITHQLRTPLASMSIMIDNICDDPDMPAEIRNEFLNDIVNQVGWMSELLNSLLTLAKFDAGAIVMKEEEIDARKLMEDAVDRLGILLDVRDVHVVWDETSKEAVTFTGDTKWQSEAVSNIIKNCAEHSPAGGHLHLSVTKNSIYTCLTIRDEGEGISPEDQRHIFERFYKAANARPESIGIGLSLAKSIVEAGGGMITVESSVGEGSTFTIKYYK